MLTSYKVVIICSFKTFCFYLFAWGMIVRAHSD